MNTKLVTFLQKTFRVIGWSILALAVMSIAKETYEFFKPTSEMIQFQQPRELQFMKSVANIFSYLSQAYFAFLVSAVFDMVFHRAPIRTAQAERFLFLTCAGFFVEGVFNIIGWIQTAVYFNYIDFSWMGILGVGAFILGVFPVVISFVYAISIYVLFRHFSQMVTFEAEVV